MVRPCSSVAFRGLIPNDLREVKSTLSALNLSSSVMSHIGPRSWLRERFEESSEFLFLPVFGRYNAAILETYGQYTLRPNQESETT